MLQSLKRRLKYLRHRSRGHFPYFGETIHFPADSLIFASACSEGIYEHRNLRLLQSALSPSSWYFDIGANIGLMSAPLLQTEPSLNVVSVEASPATAACLRASSEASPNRGRWHVVPKALGEKPGRISVHASPVAGGAYDGLRDTGRVGGGQTVDIELTTLDALWDSHGRPPVCLVKIDVEGAESQVLRGGLRCLAETRPVVLLEWNPVNLAAYDIRPAALLDIAAELDFEVLHAEGLAPVSSPRAVEFLCRFDENFLLVPRR